MKKKSNTYYDKKYLGSQNNVAVDNIPLYERHFAPVCKNDMTVLDFGCGAGILLSVLKCKHKIGVDVNEKALDEAKKNGVNEVYKDLSKLQENSVDLIVSNSALEHVPNPHIELTSLYNILKPNGSIVFRVPHETLGWSYKPGDWNYHLYTWSPMAIGNLFNDVGFHNISVKKEKSLKPPLYNFFRTLRLDRIVGYFYRLFRLILDDFSIRRVGVDGYSIVTASKKIN